MLEDIRKELRNLNSNRTEAIPTEQHNESISPVAVNAEIISEQKEQSTPCIENDSIQYVLIVVCAIILGGIIIGIIVNYQ